MSTDGFYRVCFSEGPSIVLAYFRKLAPAQRYVMRMGPECALQILTPDGRTLSYEAD